MKPIPEVQAALDAVREVFPDVTHVIYDTELRWQFLTASGYKPSFMGTYINCDVLDEARAAVELAAPDLPVTYEA